MSNYRTRWIPLVLACVACDLPRDSNGTLARVRGGTMRIGVVVDTPWTTDSTDGAGGIEGSIVRLLARDLGARIDWVHGQQGDLLAALQHRELDLVIGGLSATSPWRQLVAFTRPFYVDTVSVGGALNGPPAATLEGLRVAVAQGDPAAADVRKRGGTPQFVTRLDSVRGAIAAPTWRLDRLSRRANPLLRLSEVQHVLATAPGENAFLVRVERMLIARRHDIPAMLRQANR
jgi:polar amino acid transport system substrate-binding protein